MLLSNISILFPKEYYVDNNNPLSSNSNPGSKELPWLTIQHASNNAVNPGDVIYIMSGIYDERVTCSYSGSDEGGFINYVANPGDKKPIMRGFTLTNKNHIRIIGFEITHNSTAYSHGITPTGSCSHIEILDNYIHHIVGQAVRWYNHNNTYITIRGNEMYMAACPSDVPGQCTGNGWAVGITGGNHNLIEYNVAHRVGDFINVANHHNIIRNNYLFDFKNSYWPDGPGDGLHCDMFQPCGAAAFPSQFQVYESNFMGDNIESNSHILQMRTANSDDHNIIFRGNVAYNFGSYAMQCGGVDNVYYYNNTIHDINNISPGNPGIGYNAEGADYALNNFNFNNIFSEIGNGTRPVISVQSGCTVEITNNFCHLAGSQSSCDAQGDPMFLNTNNRDYYILPGSSAIGIGKAITTVTVENGTGNTFAVDNAEMFFDGYGVTEGDIITVGTNEPVRITKIENNEITVNQSIAWNKGDGIYWRNQDAEPDAGAYEYSSDAYDFDISITSPADGEIVGEDVNITTNTVNTGCIRFVIFFIDGIPVAQDFESPFNFSWNTDGRKSGDIHTIETRAYALFASKNPIRSDTVQVTLTETDVKDNNSIDLQISIYPNPVSDFIEISGIVNVQQRIEIFDVMGVSMLVSDFKNRVDFRDFPTGLYFLKVGNKIFKFLKF